MIINNNDMKKWKFEQLEYFRRYLNTFNSNSKEYNQVMKGIKELEKSL